MRASAAAAANETDCLAELQRLRDVLREKVEGAVSQLADALTDEPLIVFTARGK